MVGGPDLGSRASESRAVGLTLKPKPLALGFMVVSFCRLTGLGILSFFARAGGRGGGGGGVVRSERRAGGERGDQAPMKNTLGMKPRSPWGLHDVRRLASAAVACDSWGPLKPFLGAWRGKSPVKRSSAKAPNERDPMDPQYQCLF